MGFLSDGKLKEKEFASFFKNASFSTKEKDINEHWDVEIKIKIDVKSLKRINRDDYDTNENYHFVEIKNVNGDDGWVYGKADYFAFELNDYWVIVEKLSLQNFIKDNVSNTYVNSPDEALYCLYQRTGRKDIITLIKTIDLIVISTDVIKKDLEARLKHRIGDSIIMEKRVKNRINQLLKK